MKPSSKVLTRIVGFFAFFLLGVSVVSAQEVTMEDVEIDRQACDGGDMGGCLNLGVAYANGEGVKQDKSKAKALFGKACDGGSQKGCGYYKILNEEGY